jgi:hypothetical protein
VPPRPQRARITRVEIVSALTSWALSIVTTAALAAVGWFGHATHWTFGLGGHDAAHAADAGHAHADAPQAVAEDAPRAEVNPTPGTRTQTTRRPPPRMLHGSTAIPTPCGFAPRRRSSGPASSWWR